MAPCKTNRDDRACRTKIAERFWGFDNSRPQGASWRIKIWTAPQICSGHKWFGHAIDSKLPMLSHISSRDAEKNPNILTPTRKPKIHLCGQILCNLWMLAKSWIWIMRDLLHVDPKHMELRNELYDEWNKALRQCGFSLDFWKAGGQKPWSVNAVFEVCKTFSQIDRHLMNAFSIHPLNGRFFHVEDSKNSIQYHQRTKVECISSAPKSFVENSWCTTWTRGREVGLVIFW